MPCTRASPDATASKTRWLESSAPRATAPRPSAAPCFAAGSRPCTAWTPRTRRWPRASTRRDRLPRKRRPRRREKEYYPAPTRDPRLTPRWKKTSRTRPRRPRRRLPLPPPGRLPTRTPSGRTCRCPLTGERSRRRSLPPPTIASRSTSWSTPRTFPPPPSSGSGRSARRSRRSATKATTTTRATFSISATSFCAVGAWRTSWLPSRLSPPRTTTRRARFSNSSTRSSGTPRQRNRPTKPPSPESTREYLRRSWRASPAPARLCATPRGRLRCSSGTTRSSRCSPRARGR
mmetsp:Transcript_13165/g.55305  ORF Transcript_13165/g.55305 Transcript_13165/m.55305 type:complete len:290 (-) Transcript_13165:246-1115(-)